MDRPEYTEYKTEDMIEKHQAIGTNKTNALWIEYINSLDIEKKVSEIYMTNARARVNMSNKMLSKCVSVAIKNLILKGE